MNRKIESMGKSFEFGRIDPFAFSAQEVSDEKVSILVDKIKRADALVVGIASGMSAAGSIDPYADYAEGADALMDEYLGEFRDRFGIKSWFNGYYHRFESENQRFAFIAAVAEMLRNTPVMQQYWDLKELLEGKDFFVVTTNQDEIARRVFGDAKTAWIQGDWGWLQCLDRCRDEVYPSHGFFQSIRENTRSCSVDDAFVPRCPHCGALLEPWVRGYDFMEGSLYRDQYRKYETFLKDNVQRKVLFLELGVGAMTPMFIKEPFWNFVHGWPAEAFYIPITKDHAVVPEPIKEKSLGFDADIAQVLHRAAELKRGESFVTQSDSFKVEQPLAFPGGTGVGE